MGRAPSQSRASERLPLSIFTRLYDRLAQFDGEVIPLQIGDTSVPPPDAARLNNIDFDDLSNRQLYAYSPPKGDQRLREAIVAKIKSKNGMARATPENVQITAGATHGLSCAVRAVLDPGEELLVLSPHWPLINNIAKSCSVEPIEVPFCQAARSAASTQADIEALLERHITPATAAIYLSTPNNPDGFVFGQKELDAIAEVSLRRSLWVIADEVYESYVYDDYQHRSIATWPGMWEQCITAYSFSKSYALAGLRVGYTVAPTKVATAIQKMANTTVYSVPFATQHAAWLALTTGDDFLSETRETYTSRRDQAMAEIAVETANPHGSTYLFLNFEKWCQDQECCVSLLEKFAEKGVLLAPGAAFGRAYSKWARLCFTAVESRRLSEGIDRVNAVLRSSKP